MKIIHCADIHLGSKLESKFPKAITDTRKKEVLSTFLKMIDFAKENDAKVILLAGDVFDKDKPAIKDKEFFYKCVKKNPDIDFLYLNGNHDIEGSYVDNTIENLKTFSKENFVRYSYGNLDISGIELAENNYKAFYSQLNLDKNRLNIVMLHGEESASIGKNNIKIDNLKNKGIDYLALGHIHSYKQEKLDDRGVYAYSGCLEGRGFDECGQKGFILLDIDSKIEATFVPFARRTIHDVKVDVTGCTSLYDVQTKAKEAVKGISKEDILLITLIGELPVEAEVSEEDVKSYLNDFYFVHAKNKTVSVVDIAKYENDKSLIGEFVRLVYSNNEYSDTEKQRIISTGLKAMSGREVE